MTKVPEWQVFENQIADLLKNHHGDLTVKQNVKITDGSSSRRQFDIIIERVVADGVVRIAVECKCYTRKLTLEKVEAFAAKIKSSQIPTGVMVTKVGFGKGAFNKAEEMGIKLMHHVTALEVDLADMIKCAPVIRISRIDVRLQKVVLHRADGGEEVAEAEDVIFTDDRGVRRRLVDLVGSAWRSSVRQPGTQTLTFDCMGDIAIFSKDSVRITHVAVTADFIPQRRVNSVFYRSAEKLENSQTHVAEIARFSSEVIDIRALNDGQWLDISQEEFHEMYGHPTFDLSSQLKSLGVSVRMVSPS